jgi:hypothetical protein
MGRLAMRGGKPIIRQPGQKTPCQWCPKIPAGEKPEPSSAVEISPKNASAYRHYKECRAIGVFPDDPIVRRNATIIYEIEKEADKNRAFRDQVYAFSLLFGGRK